MVYGAALEKRSPVNRSVGSNPTPSVEGCRSGRSGSPGERVGGLKNFLVGSNPTPSVFSLKGRIKFGKILYSSNPPVSGASR